MTSKYPNSGTIAKNDRKEKDSHPDIKGQCEVDGVAYWISGWRKTGPDNNPFTSLSFTKKEEKKEERKAPMSRSQAPYEDPDSLPF